MPKHTSFYCVKQTPHSIICTRMNKIMDEKSENTPPSTSSKPAESNWKDFFRFTIIALVIVIPFRLYVAQPFMVSGSSMSPTFETGQYLIVDELSYRLESPARGDVIILKKPRQENEFLIKRIVGLPGETITIIGGTVNIKEATGDKEAVLDESYVKNHSSENSQVKLGNNEYFVMGDNRPVSLDSRFIGPIPRNHIVGRAFIRLFPINKLSILPGTLE